MGQSPSDRSAQLATPKPTVCFRPEKVVICLLRQSGRPCLIATQRLTRYGDLHFSNIGRSSEKVELESGMIEIGRRQSERKSVMLSATLKLIDHDIPVRVVDLSSSGVKVVGVNLPRWFAELDLCRNGKEWRGCISWQCDGEAGVQFREKCDITDWLRAISSPMPLRIVDSRRPSLKPVR